MIRTLTDFPTYVPKHVNRDSITKCFVDKKTKFVDVETVQEAVEREAASTDPFFVFETDHFIFYNSPEGTVKCSYLARDYIMSLYHPMDRESWDRCIPEHDGLKVSRYPPILLFAPAGMSSDVYYNGALRNSAIIHYKSADLDQFAQTVKEMSGCDKRLFVVAYGDKYDCVDAENTDNRAECNTEEMRIYVHGISEGIANIGKRLEQARLRKANFPNRLPNGQFKLKDYLGNEVLDGEQFQLTRDLERYHSHYSGEGRAGNEDGDNDDDDDNYEPEYTGVVILDNSVMLFPEDDSIFTSETIDDIVYLKNGEEYVYCQSDSNIDIGLTQELPEKSERLHMEYDGNALMFSRWDKFGYAYESWLDHRGYIHFRGEDSICFSDDNMRLHIVKV